VQGDGTRRPFGAIPELECILPLSAGFSGHVLPPIHRVFSTLSAFQGETTMPMGKRRVLSRAISVETVHPKFDSKSSK
jgi:hypothetical protein